MSSSTSAPSSFPPASSRSSIPPSSSSPFPSAVPPNSNPSNNILSLNNCVPVNNDIATAVQASTATPSIPEDCIFGLFPKLPVEIRLMVWKHAVQGGRTIYIIMKDRTFSDGSSAENLEAIRDIPPLLHACPESRREVWDMYDFAFDHLLRIPAIISLDFDTVFFGGPESVLGGSETFGFFMDAGEAGSDQAEAQLEELKGEVRNLTIGGPATALNIVGWLQMFWNLNKLKLPGTPDPNVKLRKRAAYNRNIELRLKIVWGERLEWEADDNRDNRDVDGESETDDSGEESEEEPKEFPYLLGLDAEAHFGRPSSPGEELRISRAVTTELEFYYEGLIPGHILDTEEDEFDEDSGFEGDIEESDSEDDYEGEDSDEAEDSEDY